jgi:hypothetical protein
MKNENIVYHYIISAVLLVGAAGGAYFMSVRHGEASAASTTVTATAGAQGLSGQGSSGGRQFTRGNFASGSPAAQ